MIDDVDDDDDDDVDDGWIDRWIVASLRLVSPGAVTDGVTYFS